jgi:hypothetical protein
VQLPGLLGQQGALLLPRAFRRHEAMLKHIDLGMLRSGTAEYLMKMLEAVRA